MYIPSPYISLICVYYLPVYIPSLYVNSACVLCMYPFSICVTYPSVSIPSSNGSSLYVYHSCMCIYPLSVWVLSFCVSRLRVYQSSVCISPPCVPVLRVYLSPLRMGPLFVCIKSPCVYPLSEWVLSLFISCLRVHLVPPSRRVFILPAYCGGMEAQARSGRRHIVYDAILRSDRGKPQTG